MAGSAAYRATGAGARIGPNAIIQIAAAAGDRIGRVAARRLFERAGLSNRWAEPPDTMVDEGEAIALHHALRTSLDPAHAAAIADDAGRRTADYLLAHRIPKPVQLLLRVLPARLAARILLAAIARNAWTFVGGGTFSYRLAQPVEIELRGAPIGRAVPANHPVCDYYAATFSRLFQALVHRHARVRETACEAMGAPACRFILSWDRRLGVDTPGAA